MLTEKVRAKVEVKIKEIDAITGELINEQKITYEGANVTPKGNWKIKSQDTETGEELSSEEKKNVITTLGLNVFAWALAASSGNAYLCLGTGITPPAVGDTALSTLVAAANKVVSKAASGSQTTYSVRYEPEDANGYTYKEAGIYERVTSVQSGVPQGTLINHILISDLSKTALKIVDFEVTITFT